VVGLEPGRKLQPSPRFVFLVHDIHAQSNNTYAKISGQTIDRRRVGSFARFARAVFGYRCMDHETKRAGPYSSRSHSPPGRAWTQSEEMTFATHPERQFMQYLRGAGWIKARTLPRSVRTVKSLLQKGWIEKQHQGPKNEVFFWLTEKRLEAKKSPVPIQEQSRPAERRRNERSQASVDT
jgi:hypothetical protein